VYEAKEVQVRTNFESSSVSIQTQRKRLHLNGNRASDVSLY